MKDQVTERALEIAKKRHGWNQRQFAEKLHVEKQHITNWLARGMPARQHANVARLLEITIEELLTGQYAATDPIERILASGRISEPSVVAYGVKLTEDAVLFAAEWSKLPKAMQAQLSALVHLLASEFARDSRKKAAHQRRA